MKSIYLPIASLFADTPTLTAAGLDRDAVCEAFSTPPKPELGDIAFGLFPVAKALKLAPPAAAAKLQGEVETLLQAGGYPAAGSLIAGLKLAGPYLNVSLSPLGLAQTVLADVSKASSGIEPESWHYGDSDVGDGQTLVIDFSSPNIAKPLAAHHLRSTMIGNSIRRLHEACGWRVVGLNYIGDWGTAFGKLIAGWCIEHPEATAKLEADPTEAVAAELFEGVTIEALNKAYVAFNTKLRRDPSLEDLGRQEFAALEAAITASPGTDIPLRGQRNRLLWEQIRVISLAEFERVYRRLGLSFRQWPLNSVDAKAEYAADAVRFFRNHGVYIGESFGITEGDLSAEVFARAASSGVAVESDGAQVIFVDGPDKPPLILRKSDGATSYHTRDLASALYRRRTFGMEKGLYVVGNEQALHFHQLFAALTMLGEGEWAKHCQHISFGLYLSRDSDGGWKKFSGRAGRSVLLHDLLDEAVAAVSKIIADKNPELAADPERLGKVAQAVGVGAIVFNDLKNGRRADVKFDWDEMLSFSGETGPYMQYQYVRLLSVRRKFDQHYPGSEGRWPRADASLLIHPLERDLLKAVAGFPDVVERAMRESEPSMVSRYLLDLSSLFSSYWTATKDTGIVSDDQPLSTARIAVVEAVRRVLGRGLMLLGLQLVDEM